MWTTGDLSIHFAVPVSTVQRLLDLRLAHRIVRVGRSRALPAKYLGEFEQLLKPAAAAV